MLHLREIPNLFKKLDQSRTSLLSLVPPSCMVAPSRKIANKTILGQKTFLTLKTYRFTTLERVPS